MDSRPKPLGKLSRSYDPEERPSQVAETEDLSPFKHGENLFPNVIFNES